MKHNIFTLALVGVAAASNQKTLRDSETSRNPCRKIINSYFRKGNSVEYSSQCNEFLATTIFPPNATVIQTSTLTLFATTHQPIYARNLATETIDVPTTVTASRIPQPIRSRIESCHPNRDQSAYLTFFREACLVLNATAHTKNMPIQTTTVIHSVPTSTAKFKLGVFLLENYTAAYFDVRPDGALYIDSSLKDSAFEFEFGPNYELKTDKLLSWVETEYRVIVPGLWRLPIEEIRFSVGQGSGSKKLKAAINDSHMIRQAAVMHFLAPSEDGSEATRKVFVRCGHKICVMGWTSWVQQYVGKGHNRRRSDGIPVNPIRGDYSLVMLAAIPSTESETPSQLAKIVIDYLGDKFDPKEDSTQGMESKTSPLSEEETGFDRPADQSRKEL